MNTIIKRTTNRFLEFHATLRLRGYADYGDYLHSEQWKQFQEWYRASGLPTQCLVCGAGRYILHHWNYENVGFEDPCDVVPLCDSDHAILHRWLLSNGNDVRNIESHLVKCFAFTEAAAKLAIRPFRLMKAATIKKRRCMTCRRPLSPRHPCDFCWACKPRVAKQPKEVVNCPGCGKRRRKDKLRRDGRCGICHSRSG